MAWSWRYEDADGKSIEGPTESFGGQADAESWLGQSWRELVESGAVTAILVDDERVEYKMSLLAA
ncbi:hypothetical protein F4553_002874 [Allocatelliglobosispora scoriae]|uniref:DUF2188 domain-containing protein n=1 Tax=Allocatelliglobosispora scoriae TaxID=643052 RepID=A0A841BP98_9ACTN|nr:hypothetical protein [Allocatelliglobosispora scoriae]MBB5869495.1 hypothetical protein [Allocatelliglobosispora scoriae]